MSIRDLGIINNLITKPDGTGVLNGLLSTASVTGVVERVTGLNPARAIDTITNGVSSVFTAPNKTATSGGKNLTGIIFNPLEQFASYTPLWTMACLTPQQFNNPVSYRNSPAALQHVVFASAGRYDSQRVQTLYGTPEYYVNNFTMQSVVASSEKVGNSNAVKFNFEIYEPYSMGILLQSLEVAAKKAGYVNYLQNAPYVLRLDIQGYDEDGKIYTTVKPKFWTLKLTSCKFSVTESGSTYKVEAIPYNHHGFSDAINVAYNDVAIAASTTKTGQFDAGTVGDLLVTGEKSLIRFLNDNEEKLKKEKLITYPDIYEIQFPTESNEFYTNNPPLTTPPKATVDPNAAPPKEAVAGASLGIETANFGRNAISTSDLGFTQSQGGNFRFKKNDERDPKTGKVKRDNMTIDPKTRNFQFAQGQSLTAIINQVIVSSDYAIAALDPNNKQNGFIKWFKLDVQVQLQADKFDPLTGDYAMKIIYRVVPFLVHESIFEPPTSASAGYNELEKKIKKAYNYIYTGKNVDILKFDIEINNLFYSGVNPSNESKTGTAGDPNQQGVQNNPQTKVSAGKGDQSKEALTANLGRSRPRRDPELLKSTVGGSTAGSTERQVAKNFQESILKGTSADMFTLSLEILGDTYWMIDSGMSNYFSKPVSPGALITEDGTMNYEGTDVYIYISFKTPVDLNENTGLYDFPADASIESPFSGIYRVVMCDNMFNDGLFKQKLKCVRMPAQPQDFNGKALTQEKQNSVNRVLEGKVPDAKSPEDAPQDTGPTTKAEAVASNNNNNGWGEG
jgi:hypothetical protein